MVLSAKESKGWRDAGICGGIFLATLLAYWPALRGGFIWDDSAHVTKAALQSWDGLGRIWSQLGATQQYYPMAHSAFWLEHRLWGDNPVFYHLLNVLLHATSACLFGAILRGLTGDRVWPWFAAFIFALHPVGVESVAWISEQKNTLSTVFYLLSALTYLRWSALIPARLGTIERSETRQRFVIYCLAALLFVLALLTKSVTSTLPAALLVVVWWKRGRVGWRDAAPLLPWLGAGVGMGLFTAWLERNYLGAEGASFGLSLLERCLLAGRVIWFYLGKLFWPTNLIFIYPHWKVSSGQAWQYAFPVAALALVAILWACRRRRPGALAGFLFFAGTLFPALGFFNVYPFMFSYVADHFQYLASLGIIALAAGTLGRHESPARSVSGMIERSGTRQRFVHGGAVLVLCVLGILTWRQCRTYRSAEILYRATLARNPDCWLMAYNLGVVLDGEGRTAGAMAQYRRALDLKPDLSDARNNLGIALAHAGRPAEAIAQYRQAIAADQAEVAAARGPARASWYRTSEANTYYNLGALMTRNGREAEAEDCYREALRLDPNSSDAYAALGRSLTASGRTAEAVLDFQRAARSRPDSAAARNDLGVALHAAGRNEEAAEQFEAALRLQPLFADAAMNLGNIRRAQHRNADAIACFQRALLARPGFSEAEVYLGIALEESNRPAEALAHYEKGLKGGPASPQVSYLLGLGFRELDRYAEAIEAFGLALKERPDYAEAENDLGITLAQSGRTTDALPHFEAALRLRPDFGEAENNLGLILKSLGRTEEADAHLTHAAGLLKAASP